jgi:hypothetical protein
MHDSREGGFADRIRDDARCRAGRSAGAARCRRDLRIGSPLLFRGPQRQLRDPRAARARPRGLGCRCRGRRRRDARQAGRQRRGQPVARMRPLRVLPAGARPSDSRGSRNRCRRKTFLVMSSWPRILRSRSPSANPSIIRHTFANTSNVMRARLSKQMSRASAASRHGSRLRISRRHSTSRSVRTS